ncbi:putative small lipoprotein YifL [Sphingomonas sp. UYAg733]
MRTLTWLSAATALLALAACGPASLPEVTYDNVTTEATPDRPAFAVDLDGATKLIDEVGAPWKGGVTKDGIRDTTTGGTIRTLSAPGGNAQIFARPDGKVWQMRLIVKPVSGCSESTALRRGLPNLVSTLAPSTPFSATDRVAIEDDMVSTMARTHDLAAIRIVVLGGCSHTMTLTAL